MQEAEAWVGEKTTAPVSWELVDDAMSIVHVGDFVVAVHGILLPEGGPPTEGSAD